MPFVIVRNDGKFYANSGWINDINRARIYTAKNHASNSVRYIGVDRIRVSIREVNVSLA